MRRVRGWGALVVVGAVLAVGACRKTDEPAAKSPDPETRGLAVRVTDEAPGLSFRYVDPETHRAKTALKRADVPEPARRWVMVYDERLPADALGAGEMLMTDLTEARPDGTYPARVVSTVGREARAATTIVERPAEGTEGPGTRDGATAAAPVPAGNVLLFVTSWCPHCKRAEAWFKGRGIPFTKLDVERDAGARDLLLKLFRDNRVPEEYASSVPVIAVGGKVLLGFDEAEVAKALSAGGRP